MRLLEKSLDWRVQNQQVIAGNIANLDTPQYTRKEMDFDNILSGYTRGNLQTVGLSTTQQGHLGAGNADAAPVQDTGGDVDLDQEIVRMSENQLAYTASVQMLVKKLNDLQTVISGGGGGTS